MNLFFCKEIEHVFIYFLLQLSLELAKLYLTTEDLDSCMQQCMQLLKNDKENDAATVVSGWPESFVERTINSSPCGQNGCHFDIFKCNFMDENLCILIWISLKFVPEGPIDNKSTLVQVMAWSHRVTSHYLSQCWPRSMLPYGVTRSQWVKSHYNTVIFL